MNEFKCVVQSETGVWWNNFFCFRIALNIMERIRIKNLYWKCFQQHKYPINEEKFKKK